MLAPGEQQIIEDVMRNSIRKGMPEEAEALLIEENARTLLSRIREKVDESYVEVDDCWVWKPPYQGGYGRITYGKPTVNRKAHRITYQLNVGRIPNGKIVCHRCHNRPCVNPEHLYAGTNGDNQRDRWKTHFSPVEIPSIPSNDTPLIEDVATVNRILEDMDRKEWNLHIIRYHSGKRWVVAIDTYGEKLSDGISSNLMEAFAIAIEKANQGEADGRSEMAG